MAPRIRTATIVDVAKRAGVSVSTVSRVINGTAVVVPETAQRVQAAIMDLNFVPRPAARILVSQKTNAIGLLLPEIGGAFFPTLLRGIEKGVNDAGFDFLIHCTSPSSQMGYRPRLNESNTDGLIVFTGSVKDQELLRLNQIGFPVVLLHQKPPAGTTIPMITIENKQGAQRLAEHLITAHQARRIAFLRGPDNNEDSAWREQGYRLALAKHGLPIDVNLIGKGDFEEKTAYETVRAWQRRGMIFDAILAGDDESAIGAIQALRESGRRVPQDIAVTGFDDVSFARLIMPALTTVRAPIEQVGMQAVRQLVLLIREGQAESEVLLPTEMVIRQSCGCQ